MMEKRDTKSHARVRMLVLCAMLAAMSVVLAYLAKLIFGLGPVRVTFENLPIIFGGVTFGPVAGVMVALTADLCSCLWAAQAPNPLILLGSALVGAVSGLLGRYVFVGRRWLSLLFVELFTHLVGTIAVKTWALHAYYGYHVLTLLPRVPLYLAIAVAESYLLSVLYRNKGISTLLERTCRK